MSEDLVEGFTAIISDIADFNGNQKGDHNNIDTQNAEYSIEQICPDKFKYQWQHQPKLTEKQDVKQLIAKEYKKSNSHDIQVMIDGKKFKCQMLILKSYSEFFAKLSKDEKLIKLKATDIDPNAFYDIYKWMISTSKEVKRAGLIPLLTGAEYLKVSYLIDQCWCLIQNNKWFNEDQAYLLYKEAKEWKCEKVQQLMMRQVNKIFLTIVSTIDFVLMDKDEVLEWLRLENIGINCEIDIFYAAARWLLHDWEERKGFLMELMKEVRFGLLPSWRIVILRKNEKTGKLQELLKNEELQHYLEDSMSYSIIRGCFELSEFPRFKDFLQRFGYKQLYQRNIIFDPYWQKLYKNSQYSYEDFQNYLKIIKSNALVHWTQIESNKKPKV